MGAQGPRMIRLSDSGPHTNYDALDDELNGEEKTRPQAVNLVGSVKEKGFSADPLPRHRISLPRPRVTPFPVARHRSDGPHWGPASTKESSDPVVKFSGDDQGELDMSGPEMAVPLSRRKPAQSLTSKWRSTRKTELNISSQIQNAFDDTRQKSDPQETSKETLVKKRDLTDQQMESPKLLEDVAKERDPAAKPARHATESGLNLSTEVQDRDIDVETRQAVFAMSPEEVSEAQAELSQKLRPELLELLRKRGAEKERKRIAEKAGTSVTVKVSEGRNPPVGFPGDQKEVLLQKSSSLAEDFRSVTSIQRGVKRMTLSDDQSTSKRAETVRGTKVGPADLLTAAPSFAPVERSSNEAAEDSTALPPTTDPWTLRVEAVRSMRFDLNGTVVSVAPSPNYSDSFQSNSVGVLANSLHSTLSVVERDYLRTEGDPVGVGYSLKETVALVRSTVPGQRAVALHLIASVLDKAIQGLQDQTCNPSGLLDGEGARGQTDWQAVWAYALGPEAELVLTLRLALDDGHSTVVAACARAIQGLLSYSANERYFDSLEALWPGEKASYTAPVFRRKTQHDEGFISGGRWKYNVKASEMFPFSDTAKQEKSEEDGKDTVADDSHVSNKDVAAGLIRMGILPRIRYILEVDQLIAAEEALLSVLICLARHSPTAADAVMTCPRLIDAVQRRFVGTDKDLSEESWSARLKAIRLLKVLSQAKKSNCVHFERIGTLQVLMGPLLRQSYSNISSSHARNLNQGYYEIMIETIRFWRVCIDYGVGLLLFSDCYSTLCFWLLPLSKEEILSTTKDEPLLLALESYLLLEHIARTLPLLHASGDLMSQVDGVNWSWSVAQAMLDTAVKWLSPECISGVHMLLEQCALAVQKQSPDIVTIKSTTKLVLRIVASVLHFLATACKKIVSEKQLSCAQENPESCPLPWLPTFLPELGLALARSGLLNNSQVEAEVAVSALESDLGALTLVSEKPVSTPERKFTFLECLFCCQTQADNDSALVAINCLNALVRVSSVVDSLIYIAKPKACVQVEEQTHAHRVLEQGLLLSVETELRHSLDLCKQNVIVRTDLLQMNVRGGPAPGVGIGWGSFCGGAWSNDVMVAQASARLALDLMSEFSSRVWRSHSDKGEDTSLRRTDPSQRLRWDISTRVNFCLSVIATSTIVNRELVLRSCCSVIFHPSTLSILTQKVEEVLVRWKASRAQEEDGQVSEDRMFDQEVLSKILLNHSENFWLGLKKRKSEKEVTLGKLSKSQGNRLGPNLTPVEEESGEDHISYPKSLMVEWVGQRLPLPSHWFLSPMVGDTLLATNKDCENGAAFVSEEAAQLEEVIKAGLVFFVGFEVLAANVSDTESISTKIPLVRKIHSLSTVFVSGVDVFLDPTCRDLIGALQNLIGDQLGGQSTYLTEFGTEGRRASEDAQNGTDGHNYQAATILQDETPVDVMERNSVMTEENAVLDFEGSIDASYMNYAETIAEQFVATSYGDHVFGRQVAFHFCLDVPVIIRLATWRVLADGRVLDLLPPLSQCAGPPQKYLYPVETNLQMLEAFVLAWSSNALDKAAKRNSLSFTLALHHLAGYLFDTPDTEETLLWKRKTARALVRSTVRKLNRQEMLSRLLLYVPGWSTSIGEQATAEPETEQLKLRLSLLSKACEGDSSITAEVQHLQKLVVSRVRGLYVGGG